MNETQQEEGLHLFILQWEWHLRIENIGNKSKFQRTDQVNRASSRAEVAGAHTEVWHAVSRTVEQVGSTGLHVEQVVVQAVQGLSAFQCCSTISQEGKKEEINTLYT